MEHFGDQEDSGAACGVCDACDPKGCVVRQFREPTDRERGLLIEVLAQLSARDGQTTGQLHRELCGTKGLDRRSFERLLGGLVRSGLIELRDESFVKDGRTIQFQRAMLTVDGSRAGPTALTGLEIADEAETGAARRRARKKGSAAAAKAPSKRPAKVQQPEDPVLVERLTQWRLEQARERGVPAFRIFNNRTLHAIAAARPDTEDELLAVPGIGPAKLRELGAALLQLIAATPASSTDPLRS